MTSYEHGATLTGGLLFIKDCKAARKNKQIYFKKLLTS